MTELMMDSTGGDVTVVLAAGLETTEVVFTVGTGT